MANRKILIFSAIICVAIITFIIGEGCAWKVNGGPDSVTNDTINDNIPPIKREILVEISDTSNLKIYQPKFSTVDFVTEDIPSKNDSTVIFVAAAAFTAGTLEERAQGEIAGDYVSGGVRGKGYVCKRNNGAFVYYSGQPKFIHKNYSVELDRAAENGGCGFAQEMMIHNGHIVPHTRPDDNISEFRALCLINGNLVIADSKGYVKFGDFINNLLHAGATEALYLDMGGWDYSWYRDEHGEPVDIHPEMSGQTNWITFYK